MPRRIGPLVLVGVLGLGVGALAVALFRWPPADQGVLSAPAAEQWVAAEAAPFDDERIVELQARWEPPKQILAPGWSGLVTSSYCAPGVTISSGDPIIDLDGMARVGLATSVPLFRPLTSGVSGPDVTALQAELKNLGYLSDLTGVVDDLTLRAWDELVRSSDAELSVIDPNSVVWLPTPTFVVGSCSVTVGTIAVPGASLAESAPRLASVEVVGLGPASSHEGRVVRLGEAESPVPVDGSLRSGEVFELVEASGLEGSSDSIQASLRLDVPLNALKVPAAAIVTDVDGQSCVITGSERTHAEVKVVGSRLGLAFVVGELAEGDAVLATPPNGARCSR